MAVTANSARLAAEAKRVLAGGVSSPVRAFKRVGGTPRFVAKGAGSRIWDADGNEFIDYVQSWGALILGHAHPAVLEAIRETAADGWSYGAPTEREVRLAEEVRRRMPNIERLRFVNSGTEATMSALRVARAAKRRSGFVKFEGCYHGHADPFLSRAGSGMTTLGVPDSAGVPPATALDAHTVPYNDLAAVEGILRKHKGSIAAVIVEPVAANMGLVCPEDGFLRGLRELCDSHDCILIFDEVITGFRVHRGGAQGRYGVCPDLTTLGKVLGGGLPLAAYGGREDLMRLVAPDGPVYQAGTLAGNPLAVAAGQATLDHLTADVYQTLDLRAHQLAAGLAQSLQGQGHVVREASLVGIHLGPEVPKDWQGAQASDADAYARIFHDLLTQGFYFAPSPYESVFVGLAHTVTDVHATVNAMGDAAASTLQGVAA